MNKYPAGLTVRELLDALQGVPLDREVLVETPNGNVINALSWSVLSDEEARGYHVPTGTFILDAAGV